MPHTNAMLTHSANEILNIAHRGARAFAPENTLIAFAKAKAFGCQMFETDVRLSRDGIVIVYHDEHLKRCTDAGQKFPGNSDYQVADFTLAELKRLDAGSWYADQLERPSHERQPFLQSLTDAEIGQFVSPAEKALYRSGDVKIPTLGETLCLAKEYDLLVNIELKSTSETDSELVDSTVKTIKDMTIADRVLVSSFNHDLIRHVRRQAKNIETAILIDKPLRNPITYLRKLKSNAYNLGCYHGYPAEQFDSKLGKRYLSHIQKISSAGFGVNIWTCNDPGEMRHLISAGVSGLISDYPNRVNAEIKHTLDSLKLA